MQEDIGMARETVRRQELLRFGTVNASLSYLRDHQLLEAGYVEALEQADD